MILMCKKFIESVKGLYKNYTNISLDKKNEHKIVNIFLQISLNICLGYSKEPSHFENSNLFINRRGYFIYKEKTEFKANC